MNLLAVARLAARMAVAALEEAGIHVLTAAQLDEMLAEEAARAVLAGRRLAEQDALDEAADAAILRYRERAAVGQAMPVRRELPNGWTMHTAT